MSVFKTKFPCVFLDCLYTAVPTEMRKHLLNVHKCDEGVIDDFNAKVKASKAQQKGTDLYDCLHCAQKFTSKGAVQNHCRLKHPLATAPVNPVDISLVENSSEPEKKKYRLCTGEVEPLTPVGRISSSVNVQNQRIKCHHPDCTKEEDIEYHLISRAAFCEHFRTEHGTDHILEKERFKNEDDYEKWLSRRQEETGTSLITQSTREEVGRVTCYKKCKHEGGYERKGNMKFGHPSKKWTGEINCTSFLKMVRTKESIQVEACFSHFGHDISVADLTLTSKQKERITEMVAQGLPNNLIVKQAKNESTENSRMHFLNSDDIRNLKNMLNLNEAQYHNDDLTSVEIRIKENSEADGFRLYVPPTDSSGSEFLIGLAKHRTNNFKNFTVIITPQHLESIKKFSHKIVILDDTYNITQYNLKLTTMTVIDNFDRSEPAGFLLSASTTSKEVGMFFSCVKKLFPEFRPTYFMTDEANCFWNGYTSQFDNPSTKKTVCRWHVYRAWKKNAKKYLQGDILQKTLRDLREMIRDPRKDRVLHRILSLLTSLDEEGSSGAKNFSAYFRTYYYDRIDEWSASTRSNISCHTSMFAEAWHSVLKRIRKLSSACPRKGQNRSKCRESDVADYILERQDGTFSLTKKTTSTTARRSDELTDDIDFSVDVDDEMPFSALPSISPPQSSERRNLSAKPFEKGSTITEDDYTRRMDKLENMWSSIYTGLRKTRRNNIGNFETEIKKVEEALQSLLLDSEGNIGLVLRKDAKKKSLTACEVMHCGLKKADPPLPTEIDDDEDEARVTDWKRCTECKQPVHFSCSLNKKKCFCSPNSAFELYPENFLQDLDSDEESE
ncbi:hypothetical protein CRE_19296 [Caenorhabditis remanei]|uniref:C2H2-type domain-containing protein n=1 Tax=Caenorhabditis remanei TaxID=31234 RepID=E3MX90_CAERE|nr:hypothetical protein CRE_19296 [Caenorhabditis remanei]